VSARAGMNGSATARISMAVTTRVDDSLLLRASCSASALMTVASIPMNRQSHDPSLGRRGHAAKDFASRRSVWPSPRPCSGSRRRRTRSWLATAGSMP